MFIKNEENEENLDNEIIVNDSVPETLENDEQIETNASQEVDEVQDNTEEVEKPEENIEAQIEERANKIAEEKIEARLIRDRVKRERETNEKLSKYQQLEDILKTGLGAKDLDDAISKTSNFYKEQGINIPIQEKKLSLNERDTVVLAKADAQDIIKCGEKEMKYEANRIANIPRQNRTIRENIIFNELCQELTSINNIKELKNKGYDSTVLQSEDFKEFSKDINKPITEVYEMYTKLKGISKQTPKSPGSAKTTVTDNEVKEFYTPEEARKFTEEDFEKNPKLEEAVIRSMQQWK